MSLTDSFITKPVLSIVFTLAIFVVGLLNYFHLPLRQFPVVKLPVVTVVTKFPGASPDTMEGFISNPIEDALTGIPGVDYIKTANTQGSSVVTIWLAVGSPVDGILTEISSKVSSVGWKFPKGTLTPSIQKTTKGTPVVFFTVGSNSISISALTDYYNRILMPQFSSLPGAMKLLFLGNEDYAMRIYVDPHKLNHYHLTMNEVLDSINKNSSEAAIGKLKNPTNQYTLYVNSSLSTPDEYNQLVVKAYKGSLIRLKDVGYAVMASQAITSTYQNKYYKHAIVFGIVPSEDANSIALADKATALYKSFLNKLPPAVHIKPLWNTTLFSVDAIHLVYSTIWLAIFFVVLVIFFFLGSVRSLIIPVLVIPCALIGACVLMGILSFSLNTLTLLAFVLAIGLVVDDAIVVVENIHRNLVEGLDRIKAAIVGTREISNSVMTMAIVVITVILPIGFSGGLTGALFKEFAFTLASTVLLSAVFALTIVPMLSGRLMKVDTNPKAFSNRLESLIHRFSVAYQTLLSRVVNWRYFVIPLIIGLGIACVWFLHQIPSELMPPENQGVALIPAIGPTSTSIPYMQKHAKEIGTIFNNIKEIENWGIINGFAGPDQTMSFAILRPEQPGDRSESILLPLMREQASNIKGVRAFAMNRPVLGDVVGFQPPVEFVLKTTGTYDSLYVAMNKLLAVAHKNPSLLNIDSDLKINKPAINITIDRDRAALLGVPIENITSTLNYLYAEPTTGWFVHKGQSYPIIPQTLDSLRIDPGELKNIYVLAENSDRVPLSSLIHYDVSVTPESLNHFQKMRSATLTAQLADGYTVGQALDYLVSKTKTVLPKHIAYDFSGSSREFMQSQGKMETIFLIALAAIYLILTIKFNNFLEPLAIMLCVPLSSAGALCAMYLTGNTLNIFTQIGLVMLVGLISKHGILIVNFAEHLQMKGESVRSSILEAAKIRLRPVLMTTGAMVFGALPLLFATGAGSGNLNAIAIVIIGGMSFGSLMTLFVLPSVYLILIRRPKKPAIVVNY